MYVSLCTVAIPLYYTSDFRELSEVSTCTGLMQAQHNSVFFISTSSNRVSSATQIFKDFHYCCGFFFYTCAVHFDAIKSFICPNNARLNCFKMLKFTLKITINAPTRFGLTKPSSGSLQCVRSTHCRLPDCNF